ncbi:MAG: acyltransferase [Oscillospiraceae bacterium]|nr:acyltransferase [Oscillospiraceae bacterium]
MDQHDYRIDRLRLLACFGVVMLHSSHGSGVGDLALNSLFRFSVPVFVIISGYFMLSGPVTGLPKKMLHLFVRMVLCSGVYMLYAGSIPENPILFLLTEPVHLWYLYATVGLYLLTPALLPFVRSASQQEYRYALVLCFLLGSCGVTLNRLGWFPLFGQILDKSKLPVMLCFTGLYLFGGYCRKFGFSRRREWLWAGIAAGILSIAVSNTDLASDLLSFFSPIVVIPGAACFVLFMTAEDVPEKYRALTADASKCTLGIYLFHTLVCDLITPMIGIPREILGGLPAMAVRGLCTFAVTFSAVWLLRRIPIAKKWML